MPPTIEIGSSILTPKAQAIRDGINAALAGLPEDGRISVEWIPVTSGFHFRLSRDGRGQVAPMAGVGSEYPGAFDGDVERLRNAVRESFSIIVEDGRDRPARNDGARISELGRQWVR
jgi:hypothetical protein